MSDYLKNKSFNDVLTLIWVGFSWEFVSRWGEAKGKITSSLSKTCYSFARNFKLGT